MKLNVGDYIRTKEGVIDKVIIEYNGVCYSPNCNLKHVSCMHNYYDEDIIIKSSPNIIDLIEVGDYVNDFLVVSKNEDSITIIELILLKQLKEKDIKSIVTKEMYSSVEYRVED